VSSPLAASFVLLTRGDRSAELARAIASIRDQRGVQSEIVVVSNGGGEIDVPAGVQLRVSRENIGIPGGRNLGAANCSHGVIFFLDDDAWYADGDTAARTLQAFASDGELGIVAMRISDPVTGRSERRHVPRLGAAGADVASDVTTFLGGGCAIQRRVFEVCGPYPKRFFYSHEESDLAWRVLDAGFSIRYLPAAVVLHPAAPPSRHPRYHFRSARNRVWLARRRLPWLVALPHVAIWLARSLWRARSRENRGEVWRGLRAGWAEGAGARRPISWRTVWRMTRLGRPPIF